MKPTQIFRKDILSYAHNQYGTQPEYLWSKFPTYAVLRRKDNEKWYGAILNIPRSKLEFDSSEEVDVLNVKCDPTFTGSLRKEPGIYPAYHMNKEHWVYIIFDGTVPLEQIQNLLDIIYELAGKKK